jgi:hypothetical protein
MKTVGKMQALLGNRNQYASQTAIQIYLLTAFAVPQ